MDFQIVNGGQTTGSIYHAVRKDDADVSGISVPLKLTVLTDPNRIEAVVPNISRCANSQNKVNTADFSANNPFHLAIEEHSRTIWAPPVDGSQRQSRWYYERARGQIQRITAIGKDPWMFRELRGTVTLRRPDAASLKYQALDLSGQPTGEAITGPVVKLLPATLYYQITK